MAHVVGETFVRDGVTFMQVDGRHEHSNFGLKGKEAHKHPHDHTTQIWDRSGHSCAAIRQHNHHKNTYDAVNMIVSVLHRNGHRKPAVAPVPRERVMVSGWVGNIFESDDGRIFAIEIRRPGSGIPEALPPEGGTDDNNEDFGPPPSTT